MKFIFCDDVCDIRLGLTEVISWIFDILMYKSSKLIIYLRRLGNTTGTACTVVQITSFWCMKLMENIDFHCMDKNSQLIQIRGSMDHSCSVI